MGMLVLWAPWQTVLDSEHAFLVAPAGSERVADVRPVVDMDAFLDLLLGCCGSVLCGLPYLIVGPIVA